MKVTTQWARDEEYHLPFYRQLTRRITQIHQLTGRAKLDPKTPEYSGGLYWSRQWEYPWAVQQAQPFKDMRVLDVGCGMAPFLIYLGQVGCKAYGSDPGYEGPDGLWGYGESFGAPHIVEVHRESMRELSWQDKSFDAIFCLSVLEHVSIPGEIESGIEEMKRVLKPEGKLILTVDDIGIGPRMGLLSIGVFTAGHQFEGCFDREYPSTRYPYHILGIVMEK